MHPSCNLQLRDALEMNEKAAATGSKWHCPFIHKMSQKNPTKKTVEWCQAMEKWHEAGPQSRRLSRVGKVLLYSVCVSVWVCVYWLEFDLWPKWEQAASPAQVQPHCWGLADLSAVTDESRVERQKERKRRKWGGKGEEVRCWQQCCCLWSFLARAVNKERADEQCRATEQSVRAVMFRGSR